MQEVLIHSEDQKIEDKKIFVLAVFDGGVLCGIVRRVRRKRQLGLSCQSRYSESGRYTYTYTHKPGRYTYTNTNESGCYACSA